MKDEQASIIQDLREMMAELVRNNGPSESSNAEDRSLLLFSSLSSNTTEIRKLVKPHGGQGSRARRLRTH